MRVLLDAGANKLLVNKLGLGPGDFAVGTEVRYSSYCELQGSVMSVGTWQQVKIGGYLVITKVRPLSTDTEELRCYRW